jgi:ELWxxDGT repeat protein
MRNRISAGAILLAGVSWAGPGLAQTPYLVHDVNPGAGSSLPRDFLAAGDRVFFIAYHPAMHYELWSSRGTAESTSGLDFTPGGQESTVPILTLPLGDQAIFSLTPTHGPALYKTDGTPGGTAYLAAVNAAGSKFAAVRGGLGVFRGDSPNAYRTDGTPNGTYKVASQFIGAIGMGHDSTFLFPFRDGFAIPHLTEGGYQVLLSDANADRASCVVCGQAVCQGAAPVDERLFMTCGLQFAPPDLWITDGRLSAARLVKDLPGAPYPRMVAVDGTLYFGVQGGSGAELWRSDGTDAGTYPLSALAAMPGKVDTASMTASNGVLFFSGETPAAGRELWRTDGTAAGTFMLADIQPGPGASIGLDDPGTIVAAGAGVLFAAANDATGRELWTSDGTVAGTTLLPQIAPGPAPSSPAWLTRAGGRAYFSGNDGVRGRELWAVDLPPGLVEVDDTLVTEGDSGHAVAVFPVRLQSPSTQPVLVSYQTYPLSALAGVDFVSQSGVLTFAPGTVEQTVAVEVVGDLSHERDESFVLRVAGQGGAVVARGRAVAVVIDDDAPRITAAGGSTVEGDLGPTNTVPFTFTLTTKTGAATADVSTVAYQTTYGGSAGEADYVATNGGLTFPAGSASGTSMSASVTLWGDTMDEPDETFILRFDNLDDGAPEFSPAMGTILDDDGVDSTSPRELSHGVTFRADLVPPAGRTQDVDWYVLREGLDSSYELTVDEISGDAVPLLVERTDGSTVVQTAAPTGTGTSLSARWHNTWLGPSGAHFRVRSAACGTGCGPDDTYRVRFYETTLRAPRVNTTGGQATFVVLQNTSTETVTGFMSLRPPNGDEYGEASFQVPARGTLVYDVGAALPPFTGSLTIAHDAPYGMLAGKVVSLDPATGFGFDTPLTYRPR